MSLSNEKIYKHSWCVRVRCRTHWNTIRPDRLKPVGTRYNHSKHVTIRSDLSEYEGNTKIKIKIKIIHPPPPPPFFPPQFPHILFFGRGGEGRGTGRGRRRHRGGATTTTAGRSVGRPPSEGRSTPLRWGGGQSPPPLLHQTKKTNKIYKSNDISTLDNKNNIL